MQSDEVYASIDYTEILIANGYDVNFLTSSNIGNVRGINVNGVSKTFTAKSNKEIGIEADFYYTPGKNQIESEENYPAGTQIQIKYQPLVKVDK